MMRTGTACLAGCTRPFAHGTMEKPDSCELLADRNAAGGLVSRVELLDYDADERTNFCHVAGVPGVAEAVDGGTLAALDFRPASATLINSMQRRQEAYHARLVDAQHVPTGTVASIHEQTRVKEPGLENICGTTVGQGMRFEF